MADPASVNTETVSPYLDYEELDEDLTSSLSLSEGSDDETQPERELTEREKQDAHRASHGLFLYSDCDLAQLEKFTHDRCLIADLPTLYYLDREQLMEVLGGADKTVTFDFLALPAELRNTICELHFAHLEGHGLAVRH